MAITAFQREVCRLIAAERKARGDSYVAGGVALNTLTSAPRESRDIDLFADSAEAVTVSWQRDRALLERAGYRIDVARAREGFVEAVVARGGESILVQWAVDSAFRFFPLVEHEDFGLVLHPFDLATNKVLALVGRLEVRDWIDVIHCDAAIQQLGYLAWAASGKDPGFSPATILAEAGRSSRYSAAELAELSFAGPAPDPAETSQRWHRILSAARGIVEALPPRHAGKCVLQPSGELFHGNAEELKCAAAEDALRFHEARLFGAYPQFRSVS